MICPACGAANEDGVPFCETCKADLEMPAASPTSPLMTESVYSPPIEEPIPLEPIQLELAEETPTLKIAALGEEVQPSLQSTDEHPVVPVPPPLPPSEYPTRDLPGAIPSPVDDTQDDYPTAEPPTPAKQPDSTSGNPKLIVVRGQRIDAQYPIYQGKNFIGRTDDKPVDIDIEDQEAPDRIWSSRQHAVINFEDGKLTLEDLNSLNGTFVNRTRVHPGQLKELQANDVIQIGTVHMKLSFE